MPLTVDSYVWRCTREQMEEVAAALKLQHVVTQDTERAMLDDALGSWTAAHPYPRDEKAKDKWWKARYAKIAHLKAENRIPQLPRGIQSGDQFEMWYDAQAAGGGCRLVWRKGIVWISRHSGYEWANRTAEAAELFRVAGCVPIGEVNSYAPDPYNYGPRDSDLYYKHEGD